MSKQTPLVSAIIPAYNEGSRILNVIRVLERHPLIGEIIVVSDGSTDDTVRRARQSSAKVIALPRNVGKGEAMAKGVEAAVYDVVTFFDADLVGLRPHMIDALVLPVLRGDVDMFTLIRDRKTETFQVYISDTFVIGGERAMRKEVWDLVPAKDRQGFQVELALNYYALQHGMRIGSMFMPGLMQIVKENKRGVLLGLWLRLVMTWDCVLAVCKLHLVGALRTAA